MHIWRWEKDRERKKKEGEQERDENRDNGTALHWHFTIGVALIGVRLPTTVTDQPESLCAFLYISPHTHTHSIPFTRDYSRFSRADMDLDARGMKIRIPQPHFSVVCHRIFFPLAFFFVGISKRWAYQNITWPKKIADIRTENNIAAESIFFFFQKIFTTSTLCSFFRNRLAGDIGNP